MQATNHVYLVCVPYSERPASALSRATSQAGAGRMVMETPLRPASKHTGDGHLDLMPMGGGGREGRQDGRGPLLTCGNASLAKRDCS